MDVILETVIIISKIIFGLYLDLKKYQYLVVNKIMDLAIIFWCYFKKILRILYFWCGRILIYYERKFV